MGLQADSARALTDREKPERVAREAAGAEFAELMRFGQARAEPLAAEATPLMRADAIGARPPDSDR